MPSKTADLLESCRSFRTLAEHSEASLRDVERGKKHLSDILQRTLAGLAENGFLVRGSVIRQQCLQAAKQGGPPGSITSVGVVTRDRPDDLRRCLTGYIENARQHDRRADFVVMDDSADPHNGERNRRMLAALKDRYGVTIWYAGQTEKKAFAGAVAAAGDLPRDVVNFALFDVEKLGDKTGANRNALLLHTTGEMCLSVDDDTVCWIGTCPSFKEGLTLSSIYDPRAFEFFPDRRQALDAVHPVSVDLLSVHERLLGRSPLDCVAQFANGDLDFTHTNWDLLHGMRSPGSRVIGTMNGLVGDCATGWPTMFLWLDGESRNNLVRSEETYRSAWRSRQVVRAVPTLCINNSPYCMTAFIGLDNRQLLPPFMPVLRNQDGLFGTVVRLCFPGNAYFGYLPWVALHDPSQSRVYEADEIWKYTGQRVCHMINSLLSSPSPNRFLPEGEEQMRRLGRYLAELASAPLDDFLETVRIRFLETVQTRARLLEDLLETHRRRPDFWAKDVFRHIEAVRQSLRGNDYFIPRDLLETHGPDEARRLTQRLVRQFGRLLAYWPQMAATAARLRAQGRRVAIPL